MTGNKHRRSVSDRARRRAIRAHAARLGVPYSVAARLLTAQTAQAGGLGRARFPTAGDKHRAWLFAMREHRSYDLRLRDTRLAACVPLGRAAHLVERFPPLRHGEVATPLYDGEGRETALALLYTVAAYEAPTLLPSAESLAWVGELGEETAVDFVCAALDRAARLLLDDDPWRVCTRIEAVIAAGESGAEPALREPARALGHDFRTMVPRRAFGGARHILDALLASGYDAHPPGTRVRIPGGQAGTVLGARWGRQGPPTHYEVWVGTAIVVVVAGDVEIDEPALTASP